MSNPHRNSNLSVQGHPSLNHTDQQGGDEKAHESNLSSPARLPDPEVSAKAKRRRFNASYKKRIVEEAALCQTTGEVGALLRREGLYSSHLQRWRKIYQSGALQALADDTRGRPKTRNAMQEENQRLQKQVERLSKQLEQAETIIEIQKKISALLNKPLTEEKE